MEISHFACGHTWVSQAVRGGWFRSHDGTFVPILALKSPHTMVVSWGYWSSNMLSTWVVAWASVIFRQAKEEVGGMYTFAIFTR